MFFFRKSLPYRAAAGLAVLLALTGCSEPTDKRDDTVRFQAELMEADRDFAREVAAADLEDRGRVWAGWFAPEGQQILPGRVVQGPSSVADLMGPAFDTPGYSLTWAPDQAQASAAGDLGWTTGRYQSRQSGPEGTSVSEGRYLTIWQRMGNSAWKVAVDTGVPDSEQ